MNARRQEARVWLVVTGLLGFLAVALGAFGAHGIEGWLAELPDGAKRLLWWKTGVDYHLGHTLLLLGLSLLPEHFPSVLARRARVCTIVGIGVFSGTLYVMTLTGYKALGMVTPLGGLCLLAAWGTLALGAWRSPRT
ncbi:MAG: DUF423 domain-containing protein [Myxococcota bacterium]